MRRMRRAVSVYAAPAFFGTEKDNAAQQKSCKSVGPFLIVPALGTIAGGVWIFLRPYRIISSQFQMAYFMTALAMALSVCLLMQIISLRKNASLAGRFLRQSLTAALAVSLSLMIVLILNITEPDDAAVLAPMSTIIFGGAALLIAINLTMVSICGYKSTRDSIKMISNMAQENRLVFVRVSILKDIFLVIGKGVISIISYSFFMFANALYSTGMGAARFVAIKMYVQDKKRQIKNYQLVGIIISLSSICYVLYSVRLFFSGSTGSYTMYTALVIAFYTFIEFGINIREAFRIRKSKKLESKALRAISFSSTLLCFVLTQTAIMSFSSEGDNSFSNALSGVVFGGLAALTGLYVIIDSFRYKKALI